jgi:hypothetical protein
VLRARLSHFGSFALAAHNPLKVGNHRHAPQMLRERFGPFLAHALLRRSVRRKYEAIVMRRNSFAVECAKVSGISNNLHLTKRAVDGGESARFLAGSWLQVFSVSTGNPLSAPPPLTQAVSWLSIVISTIRYFSCHD